MSCLSLAYHSSCFTASTKTETKCETKIGNGKHSDCGAVNCCNFLTTPLIPLNVGDTLIPSWEQRQCEQLTFSIWDSLNSAKRCQRKTKWESWITWNVIKSDHSFRACPLCVSGWHSYLECITVSKQEGWGGSFLAQQHFARTCRINPVTPWLQVGYLKQQAPLQSTNTVYFCFSCPKSTTSKLHEKSQNCQEF